jgi:hypothetical protein
MLLFKFAAKVNKRLHHIIRLIHRNIKHEQKDYPEHLYSRLTGVNTMAEENKRLQQKY